MCRSQQTLYLPIQMHFVLALGLIVSAKTRSSFSKLQGSFSHKSHYTHMHFTHTNTLTKEWNTVYEVLWQSTIAHCQWSVITPFSFRFTPMKLPLALRVMQNPDKCKNATRFFQTGITVPTDYHLSLSPSACSDSNISFTMFRQFMLPSLTT